MRDHEQEVLTVLEEFFVSTDDGYINPRADKEIKTFVEHQATSAYGAFIRDNPKLKQIADKNLFVKHYMDGKVQDYVDTLRSSCVVDVHITSTSSSDDATINHKPITINHKPIKEKATDVAAPVGVSPVVWFEFVALRKAKKARVTQIVLDGLQKEADKAGWTLEQVLKEIILRNWQSFKADWVQPRQGGLVNKYDVANVTTPPPPNQDAALRKIEEDRKKAVPPSLETLARMAELRKGVA